MPKRLTYQQFVERARSAHGIKYDYSCVVYINNSTKVQIKCTTCNTFFTQTPNCHLLRQGCPRCGRQKCDKSRSLTTHEFVERSNNIHCGFYSYAETNYVHNSNKVTITCPVHGNFEQTAYNHLKGSGCQACSRMGFSRKAIEWIRSIEEIENVEIQTALTQGEFVIPGTRYKADGYCRATNTIYEFYGDKWHGNPNVYEPSVKCHPFSTKTANDLFEETKKRERTILSLGYNLVTKWET